MNILAIETSCDETSAAVIKDGAEILSNVVASSVSLHKKTGGIIPEAAAREQLRSIIPVIESAMTNAKCQMPARRSLGGGGTNVDAIATTVGPGLIGSLLVGVETAKTLAYIWNKPLVPVNHLIAHIYANWLVSPTASGQRPTSSSQRPKSRRQTDEGGLNPPLPQFPAIALVVSGGHSDLVLLKNHNQLEWLGGTRDDAAGEAFDKTARLLGLGFPGGPAIATEAAKWKMINDKWKITLPRPLIGEDNFDFSFSGLKTAVLREIQKNLLTYSPASPASPNRGEPDASQGGPVTYALAHEVQEAITDILVEKTLKAVKKYKTPTLLIAGGVAANSRLREKFELKIRNLKLKIDFRVPPPSLCTDNAAMIGAAAYFNYKPVPWQKVTINPGMTIAG